MNSYTYKLVMVTSDENDSKDFFAKPMNGRFDTVVVVEDLTKEQIKSRCNVDLRKTNHGMRLFVYSGIVNGNYVSVYVCKCRKTV